MIGAQNEKPGCLGRIVILIIGLAAVTCWIVYANYQKGNETPETRRAEKCDKRGSIFAHTMATHYVEQRLKSPSTAKFPWYADSQVSYIGNCEFVVKSYVDAQNSFGAMLRSDYYVRLKYDPNSNSYYPIDIRIGK